MRPTISKSIARSLRCVQRPKRALQLLKIDRFRSASSLKANQPLQSGVAASDDAIRGCIRWWPPPTARCKRESRLSLPLQRFCALNSISPARQPASDLFITSLMPATVDFDIHHAFASLCHAGLGAAAALGSVTHISIFCAHSYSANVMIAKNEATTISQNKERTLEANKK